MTQPLIEQAAKKAGIVWISGTDTPAYALWCLPIDAALALVTGPGEQEPAIPALKAGSEPGGTVLVTLRGDHGGAIVQYPATVALVAPDSDAWEEIAPQLAAKRLNATGSTADIIKRWSRDCAVWTLTPAGDPAGMPDASGAAEPRPTPAASRTRKPFKLHRTPKKRT